MNADLTRSRNVKTSRDRTTKVIQLQAAGALRSGNFSRMLDLDRKAEASRIATHVQFFEAGIGAVKSERQIAAKTAQTTPIACAASTSDTPRRIFKIKR